MFVYKRDGRKERVQFDKITARVSRLCYGLDGDHVDAAAITQKVISGVYQGVTTIELDNLAAETAAYMTVTHPDYAILAARIAVSNLHKQTKKQFSAVVSDLYHYINPKNKKPAPMISQQTYETVMRHSEEFNSAIVYDRDFNYQYFGFKTLERSYLLRLNGKVAERPQHMIMRVAVGIWGDDIEKVLETYNLMSQKYFTHASPTLFNAGTPQPQMASCFLIDMKEDSIEGIYDTLKTCALISKTAGGIGLNVHRIRATGSYIAGTNGSSNGIVPMLRVFNNTARYVDQGGNKRPGAFAIYIEPWHADVFEFLDLRKNHGKEEVRARDLFLALWTPDLFMKRVEKNADWTLFCPNEAPGLADVYGDEFEVLYEKYEKEGRGRKTIKAQKLWYSVLEAQTETGNPFMVYKDACNRKSNQKNLGTIRSSNLCTEIVEYTAPDEVAVCNLASLALPTYVDASRGEYDFGKLHEVVQVLVRNLNKIIDINHYPVEEAKRSNFRHRPIALGVQGLADAFLALRLPFDSPEAKQLNIQIFETIYHGAMTASCQMAKESGPYSTYEGSPLSQGIFQYDMWDVTPTDLWDWQTLKAEVAKYGAKNSLLVAPMPTASTSQILGFNECFEPYTSNIYSRRVLAGEFQVVNPWLLKDLVDMGLWSDNMKNRIIADGGSIQNIPNIPADIKALYKTVWEISQRTIVQMAADRGAFIDQSQSLNIHLKDPTMGKITSMHFAGWKLGLKTGMYYLRTMAASAPIQFTVDQEQLKVEDTNVARTGPGKKRSVASSAYSSNAHSAVPRPMYVQKPPLNPTVSSNGVLTPTATPPPASENKKFSPPSKKESTVLPTFKADVDEGDSPKTLATEPTKTMAEEETLPDPAINHDKNQEEDAEDVSKDREGDIYAEAVLQCRLKNVVPPKRISGSLHPCLPLVLCNYEYCSWHNVVDSDKYLEAVSEDEGYKEEMTLLSTGEWQKFFAISLRQRVDSPTFGRLVNTLYCRIPKPGRDIVGALIEQRKKVVLDPRMVLYIENLLHLRKVDLADVLSSLFEPFETELRDARGIPGNLSKSGSSFEGVVLQSLSTEISEGRRPETREEAILVLRCLLHWITLHRDYSRGGNNDLSEVLYGTWEALGLLVVELGNNVIVSELLRRGLPADIKRSFIHTFPSFIGLFPQRNLQLAQALDFFKKQAGLYDAIDDALGTTLLDAADLEALSYQQSVPDNPVVLTRAYLYIFLNAMLIGRPLFDETPVSDILLARYRNDTTSLVTDLVTASFDVLANAMYRNEPNDFIFLVRSFLVNRLPVFLGLLTRALFSPMSIEYCITQALSHVDPAAFQSFTQMFNPLDSSGMLSEARQEFLFACALHKLIPEQSIERLIGDVPMQSLPEAGKYVKEDLVAQCTANPGRIEELIGELENMEGNAGEIASALVEIIHSLCASKDTMTLKSVCGALSRRTQALDVIMLFTRPFTLLQPLCHLLDSWVVEEDQGEHQPVYDEFGGILLLVFVTRHRYDFQQHDLGVSGPSSFVLRYLHDGSSSRSLEDLTSEENKQLGAWVRGLFETEAITNELISTCKPQEFYLLVATLFKQSLAACQAGVLSLDVLKSGFEYLLEPFLLPSLVGGLAWFTQTIWEMNGQSKELDNTLSALHALLKPNSMSGESSAIHSAVLSIIARPLEHSLVHIQRHQPRRQDIDPLLSVLRLHSQTQRSDATSPTELDSWSSMTGGGLSAAARHTFRALTQWGLAVSLDLAPPPSYTHRQLLVIVRILGAHAVLQVIFDEIMSQEAGAFEDVALDVAAALICAPSGANPAIPNGMFSDAPKRQLTLRDVLQLSYADAFILSKDNAYRAALTVRLYRRVEGLLQTVANNTANVIPVTDDMMVDLDSVPVGGQISGASVAGGLHTDINDVLAEVEEDIAVQEFLTGSNAFGEIS